jgi:hypothetical protein
MLFCRFDQDTRGGGKSENCSGNRLLKRNWRYACKALKVRGIGRFDGTRHSAAKWAQEAGKTVYEDHPGNKCRIIR